MIDQEIFKAFGFYGVLLALKMLPMGFLTARQRFAKNVFAAPEDTKLAPKGKVIYNDADVERVRRAHQNDIENIFLYFIIATFYLFTQPEYTCALWCFRLFTIARYLHTFAYLTPLPQPSRVTCYSIGLFVQIYMAYKALVFFM